MCFSFEVLHLSNPTAFRVKNCPLSLYIRVYIHMRYTFKYAMVLTLYYDPHMRGGQQKESGLAAAKGPGSFVNKTKLS